MEKQQNEAPKNRRAELEAIFIGNKCGPDTEKLTANIINAPNAVALAILSREVGICISHAAERIVNEVQVEVAHSLYCDDAKMCPDQCGVDWEDVRTMMGDGFDEWVAKFVEEASTGKTENDAWDCWLPCKEFWHACRYPLAEAVPAMKQLRRMNARNYARAQRLFELAENASLIDGNVTYLTITGHWEVTKQNTESLRALLLSLVDNPDWVLANDALMRVLRRAAGV